MLSTWLLPIRDKRVGEEAPRHRQRERIGTLGRSTFLEQNRQPAHLSAFSNPAHSTATCDIACRCGVSFDHPRPRPNKEDMQIKDMSTAIPSGGDDYKKRGDLKENKHALKAPRLRQTEPHTLGAAARLRRAYGALTARLRRAPLLPEFVEALGTSHRVNVQAVGDAVGCLGLPRRYHSEGARLVTGSD